MAADIKRWLGIVGALSALSCGDDDGRAVQGSGGGAAPEPPEGSQLVSIHFAPRIGGSPVRCNQDLGALGAEPGTIQLRDLRFFVHEVRLVTAAGVETPVELDQDGAWQVFDVALLDFEDKSGKCKYGTEGTHDVIAGTVPVGEYTGLRFKIGVPFELNHGDPTSAPPPLDTLPLYWGWGEGYMHLQLGTMTAPPDGSKDNGYTFAIASMGCEGDPRQGETVACSLPNRPEVDLAAFDHATQTVVLDFAAVMEGMNLVTQHGCASNVDNEECPPLFTRFGLDYATGATSPDTQTVFVAGPL